MTTWPRGPAGSWGDIEVICCDCGYAEERGKGPSTRRVSPRLLRCMMCGSRAVRVEWQAPGGGPRKSPTGRSLLRSLRPCARPIACQNSFGV
jgi:hypothetical protein